MNVWYTIQEMTEELASSLQWWFNSTCNCDGYNNLHYSNLTCINEQTGIITTTVHPAGLSSAQEMIDSVRADIQTRNPPTVRLPHGWILCLNISSESPENETEFTNSSDTTLALSTLIAISVTSLCAIIALLCITIVVIIIYIKCRR